MSSASLHASPTHRGTRLLPYLLRLAMVHSSNVNQPAPSHPVPSGLTSACSSTAPNYTVKGEGQLGYPLAHAVEIYHSAVRHQQAGLLNNALRLYHQAFHLEPNVDHAYSSEKQQLQ